MESGSELPKYKENMWNRAGHETHTLPMSDEPNDLPAKRGDWRIQTPSQWLLQLQAHKLETVFHLSIASEHLLKVEGW